MSKKILAMFLAVLMVVSLLPASVLAAENDCPIAKGKHNLDNCASYSVKKVVDATCAAAGYTLYECDACGDTFMGKPTPMLEHEKSSVKEEAKAPTFTEPGNVTKYHCDLCNTDWWESEPHTIVKLDKAQADTLFDCDEGGKCAFEWENEDKACATGGMIATCVKCGFQVVSKANHDIDYNKVKIVTNPTATANGEAEAPCKVCGEKATIVIYPNHDHFTEDDVLDDSYTLVEVPVAYDCLTGGTVAHLKCIICGDLFVKEEGVLVEKTLADLKGEPAESGKHTVPEQAGVPVLKSESDNGETEAEAATCTSNGTKIYDCAICAKEVIETIPAAHDWEEMSKVEMTCGQDGMLMRKCKVCKIAETVIEEAPEHTTLAEYQAAFAAIGKEIDAEALKELNKLDSQNKLPYDKDCYELLDGKLTGFLKPVTNSATCTTKGQYTWYCLNCGDELHSESAKLNHSIASFTVPATCAAVSYTFEYCTNANCPTYAATSVVKDTDGAEYAAYVKTQIEVIEAVENDDKEIVGYAKVMKDVVIAAPQVKGKITAFGTAVDENAHRFGLETKVEPTCTTAGTYYKQCLDCPYVEKSNPAATGHHYVESLTYSDASKRPVTVDPTCAVKGSITYTCKDCDQTKKVDLPKVTDLQYTDLAEAQAAHFKAATATEEAKGLVFVMHQEGTCTQFGYDSYKCNACGHTVIISDGQTGRGHTDTLEKTLTEAGTATFKAFNNGGYIVTINAISNGAAATGKIPMGGFTVNGVEIEEFGVAVKVPYVADAALVFALVEKNFSNDTEDRDEDEAIYSFESYTITVNYYTVVDPTCREIGSTQGQDGKIVAHNCINDWCDTDLETEGAQVYQYADKKINKLAHTYVTIKEAVTGICGELETRAEIKCSGCGDVKDLLKSNGKVDKADYYDGGIVLPEGVENHYGWDITEATCENDAPLFDLYYCAECETYHIRNFKDVVPHTWNNGTVTTPASCGSTGVKTYTCTVCGEPKTEVIPATKHKNSDGEYFTDHCNDPETNRHCVVCCSRPGKTDCATKKTNGVYDCKGMIGNKHSGSFANDKVWHEATCTAPGYWMFVCEYCDGEVKDGLVIEVPEKNPDDEKNEAIDHVAPAYSTTGMTEAEKFLYAEKYTEVDGKAYLNYVAPTVLADGVEKFECANCGAVVENTLDRLENLHFSMVATNADAPACDEFAEFSLVALTIKATGIDATLAGFNMTVKFVGNATFVGAEWAENTPFIGSVTPAQKVEDEINIMGRVIGSSEIAVEDEVLVTLYFRVLGDTSFSFKNGVYAENAVEEIKSSAQGTEIEVITLGDVNGDDKTFGNNVLNDLQAAINIFMGVEGAESYNVAADINRNGEIDLQDLQLLCNIASVIATIDVDSSNLSDDDMKTLFEIFVDLLLLNPYEGELELNGICTECHALEILFGHEKECSEYVAPIYPI